MRFGSPLLVVLFALAPALLWLLRRDALTRRARLTRLIELGLLRAQVLGLSARRRRRRSWASLIAVVALVAAALAPLWPGTPKLLPRRGLDVLFVVDVSRSMRARDVRPDRLERVKAEISASLDGLAEHRVGVVAFAGSAFVQCPLTTDMEAVRLFLAALDPDVVPQGGTALSAGLEVARNAFAAEDEAVGRAGRVVVVLSDGEDHELVDGGGDGLTAVGDALKALGTTVVVIGVGSTLGEPIPLTNASGEVKGYVKDKRGQTVVTRMSPEILQRAASDVGGTFVDGTLAADLGMNEVFARISGLEKRDLAARTVIAFGAASFPFLVVALLAMVAWLLIPERGAVAEAP